LFKKSFGGLVFVASRQKDKTQQAKEPRENRLPEDAHEMDLAIEPHQNQAASSCRMGWTG
jgi:hypothetical protein